MNYKQIPNTDLNVSSIALGTWVFGGESWSGAKESECIDAVLAAIDQGINFIDTAPIYSAGVSEEIVGKAIKGKKDKVIIATKCGLAANNGKISNDLSPESIYREIDDSLRRLNVDCIDLYQCHWPDVHTPLEKTFGALKKLKDEGKIRYIGVSNYDVKILEEVKALADIVTIQDQYSILDRTLEKELIPFCKDAQIGILAYGPLAGGILTGKYSTEGQFKGQDARSFFYKYYKGKGFKKAQMVVKILSEFDRPLNQVALNWLRQKDVVSTVLVGSRSARQAIVNAEAAQWELSEEQIKIIDNLEV